jgi:homoserine dehydrogenase
MPDVPLRLQLACAKRELALRVRVYPRLVANETMLQSTAQHELAAMTAIVKTLGRLVAEEAGAGGQAELFGGGERREA